MSRRVTRLRALRRRRLHPAATLFLCVLVAVGPPPAPRMLGGHPSPPRACHRTALAHPAHHENHRPFALRAAPFPR
jgi:hypothetical protein